MFSLLNVLGNFVWSAAAGLARNLTGGGTNSGAGLASKMMTAALALGLVLSLFVLHRQSGQLDRLRQDNAAKTTEIAGWARVAEQLTERLTAHMAATAAALDIRDEERDAADEKRDDERRAMAHITRIARQDTPAGAAFRAWADCPVPVDVLDVLGVPDVRGVHGEAKLSDSPARYCDSAVLADAAHPGAAHAR